MFVLVQSDCLRLIPSLPGEKRENEAVAPLHQGTYQVPRSDLLNDDCAAALRPVAPLNSRVEAVGKRRRRAKRHFLRFAIPG